MYESRIVRSLVPRLPRSGTRTLKLCRRGELGIFCHVESAKDRREVDATLIVRGRMRLRAEKGTKVADILLHISSYRALNNIHTEQLKRSWLNNAQTLPFCFLSYFDYVMFTYERYQALHAIHIHIPGEPGNEARLFGHPFQLASFPGFPILECKWCSLEKR